MIINFKLKLQNIGVDVTGLQASIQKDLYLAVQQLAKATYNKVIEIAGQKLKGTHQEYVSAVKLEEEKAGVFIIYLEERANWIEEGWDAPKQNLPNLLAGPKARTSKSGFKYNIIPIRKNIIESGTVKYNLTDDLKQIVEQRKFEKVHEGIGKSGKWTTAEKINDPQAPKNLQGLMRVREYQNKESKRPISSQYILFRVASQKQNPSISWLLPPRKGLNAFKQAYEWADAQASIIVEHFFK